MSPFQRLAGWVIAAAAVLTFAGLVVGSGAVPVAWLAEPGPPSPVKLALACAVAGLGQIPRIFANGGRIRLAWGEAAIIVLLYLVPAAWVPGVLLVGIGGALGLIARIDRRGVRRIVLGASALCLAGSAAAVVARTVSVTVGAQLDGRTALAMGVGAVTYFGVSVLIVSALDASRSDRPVRQIAREIAQSKLLMVIGNVIVGLLVVALSRTERGVWLVLIPPMVWLLHQAYAYRLRGDHERNVWEAFSEAMRELNRLDEGHAAQAGIKAALGLFHATSVEIVVHQQGAPDRIYRGQTDDGGEMGDGGKTGDGGLPAVAGLAARAGSAADAGPAAGDGEQPTAEIVHALVVGDSRVGELRIRRRGRGLGGGRDRYMFAAYGDALAAALHDAATHSELRSINERSTHDAIHDPLTGLSNRAAMLTHGNATLRALPPGAPVALLLLDINRFKEVNNTLGHAAGDDLLRNTAARLLADARPGEELARLGGDEFAMLITVAAPAVPVPREPAEAAARADRPARRIDGPDLSAYAMIRARRLAEVLAVPVDVAGVQLSVEASVGVVTAKAAAVDMTELLRRADIAMYQAKRAGQGVARYDVTRDEASIDRLALLAEMREALSSRDQVHLLVQPTVRLADGAVIGVEALARWEHPRRGPLIPTDFLSAVELGDLIGPFTRYVLARALEVMAEWRAQGIDVPWSVNLSARGLLDPGLPSAVAALLSWHDVPADRLIMEITESVVIAELPVIDQVLAGLRNLGIRLAVDDFGTGFSSLTFLTRVQVDEVKIDGAFVSAMVDSPEAAAIVRTTVELGRELDLRVVAEGVETAEQRDALLALGCQAAQGYLFFPPMPPGKAVGMLQAAGTATLRRLRAEGAG